MVRIDRRLLVGAAIAVTIGGVALGLNSCTGKGGGAQADDMALGDPKAPVTMVEYASVACPHCAVFNNEVFPAFKAKYIDTGKVYYISREMLTGNPQLAAAGFLVARCAAKKKEGPKTYFAVTDAIYHAHDEIVQTGDARGVLLRIGTSAGLSEAEFTACISDEAALNAVNDRNDKAVKKDGIQATPTFTIGGKEVATGEITLADLDKVIAEAAKK